MSWTALEESNPELASYDPADRSILFKLDVDSALGFIYKSDKRVRMYWKKNNFCQTQDADISVVIG